MRGAPISVMDRVGAVAIPRLCARSEVEAKTVGMMVGGRGGAPAGKRPGTITYPSEGASANAVIPTANGVQLLSVIEGSAASETYVYNLSLPVGHRCKASAYVGAGIVDEHGTVRVEFEPVSAQNAAGTNVPTRYSVDGNTLTQIVEHKNLEGVSYPVVADPLPILLVITAAALIVVAAAALGVTTWMEYSS